MNIMRKIIILSFLLSINSCTTVNFPAMATNVGGYGIGANGTGIWIIGPGSGLIIDSNGRITTTTSVLN
jgi:hypothetical protein